MDSVTLTIDGQPYEFRYMNVPEATGEFGQAIADIAGPLLLAAMGVWAGFAVAKKLYAWVVRRV